MNVEKDYALSAKDNPDAQRRLNELEVEISALKLEKAEKLPVLKAADKRSAEDERKRKAEIKDAEKKEKSELATERKQKKENK